jgi:hypothetical protein
MRENSGDHPMSVWESRTVSIWSVTANDELFFFEEDRSVRKDNTFQVAARRYEAPRDLSSRTIQVRYRRGGAPGRIVVFYKGERMGAATPLDLVANDRPPSSQPRA